jgi:hypothetical protein
MSTPNPALKAAAPELIAILQAIIQFNTNMGANPLMWVTNFPGASLQLQGAVLLQLPALATAEAGALQTIINTHLSTWEAQLQAAASGAAPA